MKILIDECLPDSLKNHFEAFGHECETVRKAGFGSKKNGELLALADSQWDVLLTSDKNIKYQQNMMGRKIAILVMRAKSNRLVHLLPMIPSCGEALRSIQPGQIVEVAPE
jgi:predicted nuclease of predicted toxin-antitoxin system